MQSKLKAPEHQVAGHKACNGQLGPLIDELGNFYKPFQNNDRGSREVAFYQSFSSDARVPDHICRFFPKFFGTQLVEASDGSGMHPHLVLEDITVNYTNPSIMDVKIGSRTWYPQASEDYINFCTKRDRETSTLSLGFRLGGLQFYEGDEVGFWKPHKKEIQACNAEEVRLLLVRFVSSNQSPELKKHPDSAFSSTVYGGIFGMLAQLLDLKSWFEDQTLYHFHSSSILMFYDKESAVKGNPGPAIKVLDFAHVFEGNGVIDHNFLGGLCSLIKFISDILPDQTDAMGKACFKD